MVGRPPNGAEVEATEPELHRLFEPSPVVPSQSVYDVAPLTAVQENVVLVPPKVLPGAGVFSVAPVCTTVCDNAGDVLARLLLSPPYTAVMLFDPAVRAEVVSIAIPEAFSAAEPSTVEPSLNVAVPVALLSCEFTVAVNVTAVAYCEEFPEDAIEVEVASPAAFT